MEHCERPSVEPPVEVKFLFLSVWGFVIEAAVFRHPPNHDLLSFNGEIPYATTA